MQAGRSAFLWALIGEPRAVMAIRSAEMCCVRRRRGRRPWVSGGLAEMTDA